MKEMARSILKGFGHAERWTRENSLIPYIKVKWMIPRERKTKRTN